MTRTILFVAALTAAASLMALGANAQDQAPAQAPAQTQAQTPAQPVLSLAEIAARLERDGYTLREIELERNHYEVKMTDPNGMLVKAYLNATTGAVMPYGSDDDDRGRRGGDDRGRSGERYGDDD